MLSANPETMRDFLGLEAPDIVNAPNVDPYDPTMGDQYQDLVDDLFNTGEDAINSFEVTAEETTKAIGEAYDSAKATVTNGYAATVSGLATARNIVLFGGLAVVGFIALGMIADAKRNIKTLKA